MSDQEAKKEIPPTSKEREKSFQERLMSGMGSAMGKLKEAQKIVTTAVDNVRADSNGWGLAEKAASASSKLQGWIGAARARFAKKPNSSATTPPATRTATPATTPPPVAPTAPTATQEPPKTDTTKPSDPTT